MAWREVLPMEERAKFVIEASKKEEALASLCRKYGISRKTGYKWIRRYETHGLMGMRERSRRPKQSPHETSAKWQARIVQEKLRHKKWGPKKIHFLLGRQGYEEKVPAASTIGEILKRAGLVQPRRRRGKKWRRTGELTEAERVNQVWAVDFKGWFRTGDGERNDPLTISDLYSRYILEVRSLTNETYEKTKQAFKTVFKAYGLPDIIRSDNGPPFGSGGVAGLSRLNVWWISLGIKPEHIVPGHPEQNGAHERMHRTLKAETVSPAARSRKAQQRRFNQWRQEFNEERPHEAIGMEPPAQRYRKSGRRYDSKIRQPEYPKSYEMRSVRHNGEIKWRGEKRFIGEALRGNLVGIEGMGQGRNQVYFGPILLGELWDNEPEGLRPPVSVPQALKKAQSVTHVPG